MFDLAMLTASLWIVQVDLQGTDMYGAIFDFTHEFTASWTDIDPRTTSGMEGAVIRHPRTSILTIWLIKHVWIRHTSAEQDSWDHICGPSCI